MAGVVQVKGSLGSDLHFTLPSLSLFLYYLQLPAIYRVSSDIILTITLGMRTNKYAMESASA